MQESGYTLKKVLFLVFLCFPIFVLAAQFDLSKATLLVSSEIKSPVSETLIQALQEEIAQRTTIQIPVADKWSQAPVIAIVLASDKALAGVTVPSPDKPLIQPESFAVILGGNAQQPVLWLIAFDPRGALFAAGHFLRHATLERQKITVAPTCETITAPEYSLRGHQLGYRGQANSYDAWSPQQYEQYIRELAIFGTNSIEVIPFWNNPSPFMKTPPDEMHRHISDVCRRYDLEYWAWMPSDANLSDPEQVAAEVKKYSEHFKSVPRMDGIFFPGGDPGENHPKDVLPFLQTIATELKKYHPQAGVWVSLQGFSAERIDYFYHYLETEKPEWLRGVVTGPGSPPLSETRFRLPDQYLHRHYPDITHNVRCDYPVLNWDQAFALTLGREAINPQPYRYSDIHNRYAPFTDGFITYSDGAHDDLNKMVWSRKGWDSSEDVLKIIDQYVRFFFGAKSDDRVTEAILGLERNWDGSVERNAGIEMTFALWQNLENKYPELQKNWRWQMMLVRAYYDTYQRRRKIYEQNLEKEATHILSQAEAMGSDKAMQQALAKVNQADTNPISPELVKRIEDYCEALFHSIGLQTSVEKYNAQYAQRGCILDYMNYPLNNRWWLYDEFEKIKQMPSEQEKLARLKIISTWDNPGKGSYYDNISNISQSPHVKTTLYDACDIAWWDNGKSRKRLSTQTFQREPVLVYEDLDPNGRYIIRIAGEGDALLRVNGERIAPIVYNKELETFKEFLIDRKHVCTGKMTVTFDMPEESHLNWRRQSKICDVWLLKQ